MIYLDEFLRRRDALMAKLVSLITQHRGKDDLRFVAAGGDGTVSWVTELVGDACALVGTENVPPIAVLSLGTGNELARVTGWGCTYTGESLVPFIRDVAVGNVVGVDSWLWRATPLEVDANGELIDSPSVNAKPAPSRVVGPNALHDFENNGKHVVWGGQSSTSTSRGDTNGTNTNGTNTASTPSSSSSARQTLEADRVSHLSPKDSNKTRRLSVNLARRMAFENDDLPHLPTLAFAPPPLTPPGNRVLPSRTGSGRGRSVDSHETTRTTKTHVYKSLALETPLETQAPQTQQVRPTRRKSVDFDLKTEFSNKPPVSPMGFVNGRHARSGSFAGSLSSVFAGTGAGSSGGDKPPFGTGTPVGPVNNGIGFGRVKNHSRGGSVDFATDGFDELDCDGDAASDDEAGDLGVVEKTSVCFFSIGFDASIAMQFHQLRERTPCCADSVGKIVAGHAVLGLGEAFSNRKYLRPGVITLKVDGVEVKVPPNARTLQFFNIHSSATGIDFFGCGEPSTPEELQSFEPPNIGDGLIEIVATNSTWHLGAIRLGWGHSHRVAQGSEIEITLRDALPVQGRYWGGFPKSGRTVLSLSW